MDAKKKAQVIKPRYFNDTKAYKFSATCAAGLFLCTAVLGTFLYNYHVTHPKRFITNNPLTRLLSSEEFGLHSGRFFGIIPPDRERERRFARPLSDLNSRSD